MNNEETLQTNNERIEENNVSLANVLETVNNLPEAGGGSSLEVYSTEETVIGTWLGKPLYRKVLSFNMPTVTNDGTYPSNAEITFSSNVSFARLVDCWLHSVSDTGYGQYQSLPYINNAGRIAKAFSSVNEKSEGLISATTNGSGFSKKLCYAIVEYTKTTD